MPTVPGTITGPTRVVQPSFQIVTIASTAVTKVLTATAPRLAFTIPGVRAAVAATPTTPAETATQVLFLSYDGVAQTGLCYGECVVTADNTVALTVANPTVGDILLTVGNYTFLCMSQRSGDGQGRQPASFRG